MLTPTPIQHETRPLSSPRIFLVRMGVFLILIGFIVLILFEQLKRAFFGNPGLNALIIGILAIGIVLAIRQVMRLFREIRWVNHVSGADGRTLARPPILLAPMAALVGDPTSRALLSVATTRSLLDSVGARLDENRELVRYLAGLLVFLGLLGTFWGLIDTVNAVGRIIGSLKTGGDASVLFDELKSSLAAPLAGMGISFSASLFGLAGSLVLGFLDLQAGQAQNRFYTELEDWLATAAAEAAATNSAEIGDAAPGGQTLASLAEGIEALVQHMRGEQQMIRDWVEAQAARDRDFRILIERFMRERAN
ncbi:MAG: flagellar motor protein MotA [Enterovirga sp.]|nr:flagellar motor protein MotA [Enterovirga sp.]